MNNQVTLQTFTNLRLWGMKEAFAAYLESSSAFTSDEIAAHLAQAERDNRQNGHIKRLLLNAQFHYPANINDVDVATARGLDKNLLLSFCGNPKASIFNSELNFFWILRISFNFHFDGSAIGKFHGIVD